MTKIRKFLLVILATIATLCLCLGIAACGGETGGKANENRIDQ